MHECCCQDRRTGFVDRQQRNVWFFSMYDIPLTMLAMQKVGFGVSVRFASAADQPVSLPIAQWCFVAGIGGPESDNVSSSVVILLSLAPFCLTSLTTYALSSAQPTPTFPFRSDTI